LRNAFHPDAVTGLVWQVGETRFEFRRGDRNQAWEPGNPAAGIQERLNFLAQAEWRSAEPAGETLVQVELTFSNDVSWRAAWDGRMLTWSSGEWRGFGAELNEANQALFQAGRFAFDSRALNWCHERIISLEHTAVPKFFFFRRDGEWWKKGSPEALVNPTPLEKWLGDHCVLQVEQFLDPQLLNLPEEERRPYFEVLFTDRQVLRWLRLGQNRYLTSDKGFIAKEFGEALEKISKY
jgi:hypothetical protein